MRKKDNIPLIYKKIMEKLTCRSLDGKLSRKEVEEIISNHIRISRKEAKRIIFEMKKLNLIERQNRDNLKIKRINQ